MNVRASLLLGLSLLAVSAPAAYAQTVSPATSSYPPLNPNGSVASNPSVLGANGTLNPVTGQSQYSNPDLTPGKVGVSQTPIVKNVVDHSSEITDDGVEPTAPDNVDALENLQKEDPGKKSGLGFEIRKQAIKDGALSYGARGGLAWRTYNIRVELEKRAEYMDKVYNFRRLLIPAPSGFLIEPPIVDKSLNAMLINGSGQEAAVTDKMYNIVHNAKIVSTSRTWRTYLERVWGTVDPPPDILRPETPEERKIWKEYVRQGWDQGVSQADDIFHDDLMQLSADFQGMVNYRMLLAQGMISAPYALQVDRGVTGGKNEMRVGDRAVQITGVPELITGSESWQPASQ